MRTKNNRFFGFLTRHFFICGVIFFLVIIGPIVIAVDLTFLADWVNSLNMGDFYTYLAFIGIVSVWSVYGLIVALMSSVGGITAYTRGLCIILVIQFIIGFVHIMLLFITYRPILMDSCLQRQPNRNFWWSLGYENNEELSKIYSECSAEWNTLATERGVSFALYSFISFLCLFFIIRYQRFISYQHYRAQGIAGRSFSEWSDDEEVDGYSHLVDEKNKKLGSVQTVTYYNEEFPEKSATGNKYDSELTANMYQQRQKLFDEIAKRKRARKSLNRKSLVSNLSSSSINSGGNKRDSVLVVHPLDLSQDPEVYQPPPMPPSSSDHDENWTRYNEAKEEQEAIERQKRVDALSTERLEYEMYRRDDATSRQSSISEVIEQSSSRRKRPAAARWSACYSDIGTTSGPKQPLTSIDSDDNDPEDYMQEGYDNYPPYDNEHLPIHPYDQTEDKKDEDQYEDFQHEDNLSEDEEENNATSSLMTPTKEEKI